MVGTGALSWLSKKQHAVYFSSIEGEYRAAICVACEGILFDLQITQADSTTLYCES
jgi:hypothetical protein